jgi:hypothetical protein
MPFWFSMNAPVNTEAIGLLGNPFWFIHLLSIYTMSLFALSQFAYTEIEYYFLRFLY